MIANYFKKFWPYKKNQKINKSFYSIDLPFNNYNFLKNQKIGAQSYLENVIVYRCVNLIAQSASHVPWVIYKSKNEQINAQKNHPAYKLLQKPNPFVSGADFFEEIIANILLFGNSYLLTNQNKEDRNSNREGSNFEYISPEIYILHSPSTNIVIKDNEKIGYNYQTEDNRQIFYPINKITQTSQILHIKNYHPLNRHYGLSALEAASLSIELHTAATKWNNSLLKNGARPSGALIVKDNEGYLSEEQFTRLQNQLYEKYTGLANSSRPLLLEGGLEWREMSINPRDMDFIESKNAASREIALAFGVPPQLLGIKGDNTYSNMSQARLALWEETLIPLLDKIADNLGSWLSYLFQDEIILDFDRENISALIEKRENLWEKVSNADFMTINEKRSYFGLAPISQGDNFVIKE